MTVHPRVFVFRAVRRLAPLRDGRRGHPDHHVWGPARRALDAGGAPEPRAAAALAPVSAHGTHKLHAPQHGLLRQRRAEER